VGLGSDSYPNKQYRMGAKVIGGIPWKRILGFQKKKVHLAENSRLT